MKKLIRFMFALGVAKAAFHAAVAALSENSPSEVDELVAEQKRIREEEAREDRILKRILVARRAYEGNPKVWN